MISEELMAPGRWDINLTRYTPDTIRDGLDNRGHVFILPEWIDPATLNDASIKAFAKYTGRCYRVTPGEAGETGMSIGGYGLESWLGLNGRGPVIVSTLVFDNTPWNTFVNNLLNVSSAPHLQLGTVTGTPGSVYGTFFGQTIRAAFTYAAPISGAEWRINPNGTIDSGTQAELFTTTPDSLFIRKTSGFEPNLEVLGAPTLDSTIDAEEWVAALHILGKGDFYNGADDYIMGSADLVDIGKSNPYKDLFGNADDTGIIVNDPVTFIAQANPRAQVLLTAAYDLSQTITLSTDNFDVSGPVALGDTVWVYSPPKLADNTNWVKYADGWVHPIATRIFAISWPVVEGMGVVYRNHDGSLIDLTPYVDWEAGATTFTVGDRNRSPFDLDTNLTGITLGMVNQPSNATDTPDIPTHVNTPWSTSSYVNADGVTFAQVQVEWSTPLNTDGSTVQDGSHYTIRFRINGEIEYSYVSVEWGTNVYLLQNLIVGQQYEISIAAYDFAGRSAGYGPDTTVVTAGDGIPPSKPAIPIVAGNPLEILVKHELGKDTGGTFNLELDTRRLDVHISATTGFTPDATTLVGAIPVTLGNITGSIPVLGVFTILDETARFIKVVAVDAAGNESTPSEQATVSATLLGDTYITDLTVNKLTGGTINTTTINVASVLNIASGGYIRSNYVAGVSGFEIDGGTGNVEFNDAVIRGTVYATAGELGDLDVTGTLDVSGTIQLTSAGVIRTAPSGNRVQLISNVGIGYIQMFSGDAQESTPFEVYNVQTTAAANAYINGPKDSSNVNKYGFIDFRTQPNQVPFNYLGPGGTVNTILRIGTAATGAGSIHITADADVILQGNGPQGVVVSGSKGLLIDTPGTASDPAINIYDDFWLSFYSGQCRIKNNSSSTEVVLGGSGFAPSTDGTLSLGASTLKWLDLFLVNDPTVSSDPSLKDFTSSDALSLDFVKRLRPSAWKWKDGGRRLHHGLDSDSVVVALHQLGLTTEQFAGYVESPEGVKGLRYGEFIGPIVAAVQELAHRIEALEHAS